MNTMNPYPLRVWRRLKHRFTTWHARAGLRIDRLDLGPAMLGEPMGLALSVSAALADAAAIAWVMRRGSK